MLRNASSSARNSRIVSPAARATGSSKHATEGREVEVPQAIDTFTLAPWIDGFRERLCVRGLEVVARPVAAARTWLLTIGWRRHGLLSVHDLPATS